MDEIPPPRGAQAPETGGGAAGDEEVDEEEEVETTLGRMRPVAQCPAIEEAPESAPNMTPFVVLYVFVLPLTSRFSCAEGWCGTRLRRL